MEQELGNIFSNIFANNGYISLILLVLGIVFLIIEFFVPGFGAFGIMGILFLIGGVVYKAITGGTVEEILFLVGISLVVIVLFILIGIHSAKHGILKRTPIVNKETALPVDYADDDNNYGFLVGKIGKVISDCKLLGKAVIEDKIYKVISVNEYLYKNTRIEVDHVDGNDIFVKKIVE